MHRLLYHTRLLRKPTTFEMRTSRRNWMDSTQKHQYRTDTWKERQRNAVIWRTPFRLDRCFHQNRRGKRRFHSKIGSVVTRMTADTTVHMKNILKRLENAIALASNLKILDILKCNDAQCKQMRAHTVVRYYRGAETVWLQSGSQAFVFPPHSVWTWTLSPQQWDI